MIKSTPIKCPVCKKKFYPELGEWAWRIGTEDNKRMVCSYGCMRKWQKAKENTPQALAKAERIQKELKGCGRIGR